MKLVFCRCFLVVSLQQNTWQKEREGEWACFSSHEGRSATTGKMCQQALRSSRDGRSHSKMSRSGALDASAQLTFSSLFQPGHQSMGWCHPLFEWIFLLQQIQARNYIDMHRGLFHCSVWMLYSWQSRVTIATANYHCVHGQQVTHLSCDVLERDRLWEAYFSQAVSCSHNIALSSWKALLKFAYTYTHMHTDTYTYIVHHLIFCFICIKLIIF